MEDKILAKLMSDSFYKKVDPRRRQEVSDSRMIYEDHNQIANLSDTPIYREFNPDRFKHDCNSAGSPVWKFSEIGEM
jgi:hypothetical protein